MVTTIASFSNQGQVQTQVLTGPKDTPQGRLEGGTGPYGATPKRGMLSRPLTHTQGQVNGVFITKSDIEVKGNTDRAVMGTCVDNEGMIEFEAQSKETVILDSADADVDADAEMTGKGSGPVLSAAPSVAVKKCVIGCEVKTKGIKFG